jgi:inhibitor of cysteine peptidase
MITRPFLPVDTDRTIVLAQNRTFEIVLPSNPSTGYDWELQIENPKAVENKSHTFTAHPSGRIGAPGTTTWKLRTGSKGETKLHFSYRIAWDKSKPPTREETFTISVR